MTHQIYALEYRNIKTGDVSLVEMEDSVCFYLGERAVMKRKARDNNKLSQRKGWPSRYRAVPLPYTTSLPEWFDFA
jgi:hypothetical protein